MNLTTIAHSIVLSWGWRRRAIALGAGAVTVLALPPFNVWPVAFLTFPILVWLIDGAAGARLAGVVAAFGAGWWFGFGYFLAGLYWVGSAFLVDADTFGWLLPIAVIALPAGLALFTGFGVALARALWPVGATRVLALAFALTIAEWLRGHLLTGFPWNAFGYLVSGPLVLAQGAALVGLWGMTFVAVAVFASPATLAGERGQGRRYLAPSLSALALIALAAFGLWRLETTPTTFVDGVRLRLMQPNLQQDLKFNYDAKDEVMRRYLALSDRSTGPRSNGIADVTHLIWPESAFPFFLPREPAALAAIANLLPQGTVLITGGVRPPSDTPDPDNPRAHNSIYVVDHDGSILSVYDKVHLVPFGEYLPWQSRIEALGLRQLTKRRGGFIAGDRRRPLNIPRAPAASPLICYEAIFPGAVRPDGERPGWLLNLTNDGWFGISIGPHQHYMQARMRAIEEGLPLVRVANTGISAVFDPLGRTLRALPLGVEGVIDAPLPRPVAKPLYTRVGDSLAGVAVMLAFVVIIRRRPRTRH